MTHDSYFMKKALGHLTKSGSRTSARRLLTSALDEVSRRLFMDPEEILAAAMNNAMPMIEIRIKHVGGLAYQVPVPVPQSQKVAKGIKRILESARRKKTGRVTVSTLASALLDYCTGELPRPDRSRRASRLSAYTMYRTATK